VNPKFVEMGLIKLGLFFLELTGNTLLGIYDYIIHPPIFGKRKRKRKTVGFLKSYKKPKTKNSDNMDFTENLPLPSADIPLPPPLMKDEKLEQLENELSALRNEIAKIMANPKPNPKLSTGAAGTMSFASEIPSPPSFLPPFEEIMPPSHHLQENHTNHDIPLPPPPPQISPPSSPSKIEFIPPPTLHMSNGMYMSRRAVDTSGEPFSLADIVRKGTSLKKVNVERSPGGTPIRPIDRTTNPITSQDMIALALKKKFTNISPQSPEKGEELDTSSWDDKENIVTK